jgi:hypothetical protein
MSILVFLIAVFLSAIAAYYSVMGMIAIFASAAMPVALMASGLEAAKLITASWLYRNWSIAPRFLKYYLSIAVVVLMLITSMGIFGFLSKAHMDQTMLSGDSAAKIAIYDEKIKTAKDNIDANRKALRQLDEAVDQVMARSTDAQGADKAVVIRRSQQKERTRLLQEIEIEQKKVAALSEESAPIRSEVRKIEAEVGPIKHIAKLIYGDNIDQNLLEKAVTWVIILLIFVFDPLAVLLLIAANIKIVPVTEPEPPKPSKFKILAEKLKGIKLPKFNLPKQESPKQPVITDEEKQALAEASAMLVDFPVPVVAPKRSRKKKDDKVIDFPPVVQEPVKKKPVKKKSVAVKEPAKVLTVELPKTVKQKKDDALNKVKKIVADDTVPSSKIKVQSTTTDLEEQYKNIVSDLAPKTKSKKSKPTGWFPPTKK